MRDETSFSVLGPMAISNERDTVMLASSKPTMLLAAMLLRPCEVVSAEFLQRVIWGDAAPDSARATLQTYILRLRQLFAKFGVAHDAIRTVPGGYCLPVGEDSLDLAAFRGLRKASQAQPAPEAELRLLNQALALWRGTPVANIQSELLHRDEVPRLCDEWIHASERCFDLQFSLGQYHQALPRLRAMTQAHPGHERLWEQLIEALYQVGRTAEALAGYRHVKQHLGEEYGIDPGSGLQRLELSILRGEALRPSAEDRSSAVLSRAAATVTELPGQFCLPGDLPDFAGRTLEVAELSWRLAQRRGGPVVAVISGPPGIGKTALATHVAHLLRNEFPGGCRFVRLADHDGDAQLAAERASHGPGGDGAAPGQRTLTIVDGVQSAGQIGPFLLTDSSAVLVATSRLSLGSLAATRAASLHRLAALDPADSLALLKAILGPRLDRDIPAARELAALCGHFPAAVRIAATRLTTSARLTLPELTERLRDDPIRLLSLPGDPDGSVAALFGGYLETLDADAADAFAAIGSRGPEPFTLAECAKILDQSEQDAELVIERLIDRSLLENEAIAEYRMQELLCAFALARTENRGYQK
jgi:DNA-binding SARP family transcriptional activator